MKSGWRTIVLVATAVVAAAMAVVVVVFVVVPHIREGRADPARLLAARADRFYGEERYDDAAAVYEQVVTDYPSSPLAVEAGEKKKLSEAKSLFAEARMLARAGRYYEAGDLLSKATTLAPDDVEVNYGVGWIYFQLAVDNLASAQLSGGGRLTGDYLLLTKTYAELARQRFERCVALDAKHWAGYRGLALYHIFSQEYDEGLKDLATADKYSTKPEDKVAVGRMRVQAYIGKKDYAQAKATLDALLEKYPDRGDVYYSLAEYYLRQEKPDVAEAKKALEVGVGKTFDDPGTKNQLYGMLSRLRRDAKDYDGAVSAAADGLAGDPFNDSLVKQYTLAYGSKLMSEPSPAPKP